MKHPVELYACVHLREFPAQALLRLRSELKQHACVVMDGEAPFEFVCSVNSKARRLGIKRGMSGTDVDGFPQVKVLSRSLKTESRTKEILMECAGTYSPRIEDWSGDSYFLCAIDIAGTESMFGPPQLLARRLLQHIASLGLSAQVRISNNFHTAACLAKVSSGRSIDVVPSGEEAAFLSPLPLTVLPLTDEQAELFALWGIHTVGTLALLPKEDLVSRIGQDGRRLQQLARGECPHLFRPVSPPFKLEERQELDFPIDSLDSLMFGIAVMLDQLILRTKARLVALAAVTIVLELDGGERYKRRVRPAQPGNDKQFWVRLLHLDLQSHAPQAAVVAVTLDGEPGDTSKVQLGIFSPPLPESTRLDVTLAQLKSLLGDNNVGQAVLQDSHALESFRLEPFSISSGSITSVYLQHKRAAVRRIRPPEGTSVHLEQQRPKAFIFREQCFDVEYAYGPWIARGEWWNEMFWNMEQWDVIAKAPNEVMICCCIACDLLRNEWQVIALYD